MTNVSRGQTRFLALGALGVAIGVAASVLTLPAPAQAQMLKSCVVGQRVVDESGATGVIKGADAGFCDVAFDNGKRDTRMFYVLRPASAANQNPATPLANGEYDCAISYGGFSHPNVVQMGRMDIAGKTYRFRPMGKATDGFAGYSVGGDGSLHWAGHMGALDKAPARLLDSRKTPEGFNVRYMPRPGGDADTMSCHHV